MNRSTTRGAVVLVIGATSGVGLATARSLVGQGASVVLMARAHDSLERAASALARARSSRKATCSTQPRSSMRSPPRRNATGAWTPSS